MLQQKNSRNKIFSEKWLLQQTKIFIRKGTKEQFMYNCLIFIGTENIIMSDPPFIDDMSDSQRNIIKLLSD